MKVGGEPLQQEFNRGYDFILNTYGSAENIMPGKNTWLLLSKGIVIDVDFDIAKNYKNAAGQPPFSIYAKIIGEDLDVDKPDLEVEKIYYSPLLPIHNICVPEIGEEIIIMRESNMPGSKGYYFGRVCNTSSLNYSAARKYMDNINIPPVSPEFKYGFSFDVDKLRENRINEMPSDEIESISIPVTFGDVVQQGRSQSYIRHSFNKNNKKGVLEQGLRTQEQHIGSNINNSIFSGGANGFASYDPSIGHTATKTIHFVDTSIKRLGDYSLASTLLEQPSQGELDVPLDKSFIVNMSDEIYNISTKQLDQNLYRQVLGEKLISHQQETNNLIRTMLDGVTGLTETVQVLLDAFIEHEHALPKIELNLEKEIKSKDLYRTEPQIIQRSPQIVRTPDRKIRTQTGTREIRMPIGPPRVVPVYSYQTIHGSTIRIPRSPRIIPGRIKARTVKQKINFEAIIGGEENPRFTAPIQTDTDLPNSAALPEIRTQTGTELIDLPDGTRREIPTYSYQTHPGVPPSNSEKTELGLKTDQVNTDTENLIDKFNNQKVQLNNIFNKATDFLSRNQFVN